MKHLFVRKAYSFLKLKMNLFGYLVILGAFVLLESTQTLDQTGENYTWIYSASMQTLAAIIALLPISYSFYTRKIEDEQGAVYDSYILKTMEKDGYFEMMFVVLFSVFSILLNLLHLFTDFAAQKAILATMATLLSVQFVVVFIYRLFDPERVKNILKEFDQTSNTSPTMQVSLDTFISKYLQLENTIKDYISKDHDVELVKELPLYNIIDDLSKDFPLIETYYDDFKDIIFHRNNVIHNYNQVLVDADRFQKIIELIDLFEKENQDFVTLKIFHNVSNVKQNIVESLREYMQDYRNQGISDQLHVATFERTLNDLLELHFVSDYFTVNTYEDSADLDFEILQNNYSNKKLVGIELKMTDSNNFKTQANAIFKNLKTKFLYLFVLNFDIKEKKFEIAYTLKDLSIKYETINIQ